MKVAIISGARGMDASWLAELLLSKGMKVIAFERMTGLPDYRNISHLFSNENYILENADLCDGSSVARLVIKYQPDYFFNVAASSFVGSSYTEPVTVWNNNSTGVINCLEAIRNHKKDCRFVQCSTSERYGNVKPEEVPLNENSPARPVSPYAAAKVAAEHIVRVYKTSYGIHASIAISFNHTGTRRSPHFVERKITSWVGNAIAITEKMISTDKSFRNKLITPEAGLAIAIERGLVEKLKLGYMEAKRDFTDARDIVNGLLMLADHNEPEEVVFCSGTTYSIREILSTAFGFVGIEDWTPFVAQDAAFCRPSEVPLLLGDNSKAKSVLNWVPTKTFEDIIQEMVSNDIELSTKAIYHV